MGSNFAHLESLGGIGPKAGKQAKTVPVDAIAPARVQYRLHFDDAAIAELADIFRQHGFRGAVWVEPAEQPGRYRLISGERRWRAAQLAGLAEIPVEVISGLGRAAAAELGYLANSASKSLNLIEDTRAVLDLLAQSLTLNLDEARRALYHLNNAITAAQKPGQESKQSGLLSQDDQDLLDKVEAVFDRIKAGNWRHFVRNRVPLLHLPDEVMAAVESGKLDGTKAQLIGRVKDDGIRAVVLEDAIANQLSKREVQQRIKELTPAKQKPPALQQYRGILKRLPAALADPGKEAKVRDLLKQLDEVIG